MPCILLVYSSGAKSVRDEIRPECSFYPPSRDHCGGAAAAAALHWAMHVTFNLHVAADNFEVSGELHTGTPKFCFAAENTY